MYFSDSDAIDLSGRWSLTDDRGEHDLEIAIPGDVHTALLAAGRIPDPFVGTNENDVQWVGRRGWTIARTFELDGTQRATRWLLEIDVVDTVAEIVVNGALVARTTSMFVPVRADIADALVPGVNTIEVRFDSAEREAERRATTLPYPVPHQIYPNQSMHRNLVRKAQCHGSWDWGIALMVAGIAGTVRIRPVPDAAIRAVWALPRRDGAAWRVPVTVEWDELGVEPGGCDYASQVPPLALEVRGPDGALVAALDTEGAERVGDGAAAGDGGASGDGREPAGAGVTASAGVTPSAGADSAGAAPAEETAPPAGVTPTAALESAPPAVRLVRPGVLEATITVADPALWWPAGYGDQPLYDLEVRLGGDGRRLRIAFRDIAVVNERDEVGVSMTFRVNGRYVWAKGANWIPMDAFPTRQTAARARRLLTDMRDAHMNMVRVWGGGQYEPDSFYEACDELGILVWQDFMFSCSLYPSERWFLGEVRDEVRAQMRRLASHPSIAIWCGNNENIGALGWYEESLANPGRYLIDFDRLTYGVIAEEVAAVDDTRVFWPSSPAAGPGDFSDNWHDDSSGDMHYWSVWHEGKPFTAYYEVTPRFCSEFGFQSFPSRATLRSFASEDDLNPTAPTMEHHQRNPRGNTVILESLSRIFRFPFDFGDFVYLSQVQQAMAISMAVTYWRSRRPTSMGALYWQLNDLWPVVSWSSIEYDGRWKALHYAARRFFEPVRPAIFVKDGVVEAHLFNDSSREIRGDVAIQALTWTGAVAWEHRLSAVGAPDASTPLWSSPLADLPVAPREAFLVVTLDPGDDATAAAGGELRDYTLLTEYKDVSLVRPVITIVGGDGWVDVTASGAPAFWTTLELDAIPSGRGIDAHVAGASAWQPADNGFFLRPGETRRIAVPEGSMVEQVRTIAHVATAPAAR